MADRLNNVELYKSMSDFFRNVKKLSVRLDNADNGSAVSRKDVSAAKNHLQAIVNREVVIRKNIQRVNANNIHLTIGNNIKEDMIEMEKNLLLASSVLYDSEVDYTELKPFVEETVSSLSVMRSDFNNLQG